LVLDALSVNVSAFFGKWDLKDWIEEKAQSSGIGAASNSKERVARMPAYRERFMIGKYLRWAHRTC
jgi:hypothetical protein